MNALPAHRQISAGRTWSAMYRPESYAPISHYHRTEWRATAVMVVLAVGTLLAIVGGYLS